MGEVLSRMAGYFLFVISLIVVVMIFLARFDTIKDNAAYDKTAKFINECQTTGVIDTANYIAFCKEIYGLGSVYTIELEYDSVTSYPDLNDDGTIKSATSTTDYRVYSNDDIIAAMYPETGDIQNYEMKNGDILTCTITREPTSTMRLIAAVFRSSVSNQLVARYSGTIGN